MERFLPDGKIQSILPGNCRANEHRYPSRMQIDARRTQNFLRLLRERYDDSPSQFEKKTGYGANMVSQIKTGKKMVKDKLARKLETLMKLPPLTLDGQEIPEVADRGATSIQWPFSIPLEAYLALSPRARSEIDDAVRKMVLGAQAEDLLNKPRHYGRK